MSRSATPATRNEATTRLQPPKRTTSAKLPIGTAIRGSRERLRTVADGCERLRTVANGCDRERNVERTHPQPPDPQSETGTLATHSGILKVVHRRKPVRQMAPHITDTPWTPRKSKPLERAPRWVEKGLYH